MSAEPLRVGGPVACAGALGCQEAASARARVRARVCTWATGAAWLLGVCGPSHAQSLAEVVRRALAEQPASAAAQAQVAVAQQELARSRSERWPVLSAQASTEQGERNYRQSFATPVISYGANLAGREGRLVAQAEHQLEGAQASQRSDAEQTALQAAQAYLAWARSLAVLGLAQRSVSAHERMQADLDKIAAVDIGRRIDAVQVQVRVDHARLALIQQQASLQAAQERLLRYWPAPLPSTPQGLDDAPLADTFTLDDVAQALDERHPVLAEALARVQAAEQGVAAARTERYPDLAVHIARQPTTATGLPHTVWTGRLSLSMPLLDAGGLAARAQGAQARHQAARAAADDVQASLRERARTAWLAWQTARQRLAQVQGLAERGQWLVQGYEAQFRLGRRSLLDVLNAQSDALGYESQALDARFDERQARLQLAAVLGRLAPWATAAASPP